MKIWMPRPEPAPVDAAACGNGAATPHAAVRAPAAAPLPAPPPPPLPAPRPFRVGASGVLCALLLAACATEQPTAPTAPPAHRRPAPVKPAPAVAPAAPPAVAEPGQAGNPPSSSPIRPEPAGITPAAEWQQLAPYQKSPFQVFSLSETQAGLQAVPGAVGVYGLAAPRPGNIRLRFALRPDSPVRLGTGAYTVQLQLAFEYIERRTCKSNACQGDLTETNRKAGKTVRLLLAPQRGYVAETTLALPLGKAGQPERGYDVAYSDLVMKVRRVKIAPARRPREEP
jgi:hypothetical protein